MKFWLNILDLTKNRKTKAFLTCIALLLFDKIDQSAFVIGMGIFVGGNSAEKIAKIKHGK